MTIRLFEVPGSRKSTSQPPGISLDYKISGVQDAPTVRALAESSIATTVVTTQGIMMRGNLGIDPEGFQLWKISAVYAPPGIAGGFNLQQGQMTFSFDTTGGTMHLENSKPYGGTQAVYKTSSADTISKDIYGNTIGWNKSENRVEGVDRAIPALRFQVTFRHPHGFVSIPRMKLLASYSACVNSDTFLTFAPGEVLFLGANGTEGTNTETDVTYHFEASQNVANLTVGDIVVVMKQGHDYAWIAYKRSVDTNVPVLKPEYVFVERIYTQIPLVMSLGFG